VRGPRISLLLSCALLGMAAVLPAAAQQGPDPAQLQQALARAQGLLRQLGQQKQQLEVEAAKLKGELAAAEKRLRKAELDIEDKTASLAVAEASGKRSASALERTQGRLDQTTAKLKEVIGRYKETAGQLRQTQFEKEQLEVALAGTTQALRDAEASNLELYRDNREILELYRNKSGWAGLLQREPVTGLKSVEIENVIEEYQYKMYDHVLETNLDAAGESVAPAATEEPAP
jgi:septal ring factor EnvC (AmiA/AmiB activator)